MLMTKSSESRASGAPCSCREVYFEGVRRGSGFSNAGAWGGERFNTGLWITDSSGNLDRWGRGIREGPMLCSKSPKCHAALSSALGPDTTR